MLIGQEQGVSNDISILNEVVVHLRKLVGDDHPDVAAISLACPDVSLRRTEPVRAAPIFERSWRMLVDASAANRRLLPISLWRQVHADSSRPPFLSWTVGPESQEDYLQDLASSVFSSGRPALAEVAPTMSFSVQSLDPLAPGTVQAGSTTDEKRTGAGPVTKRAAAEAVARRADMIGLPRVALAELRKRKYLRPQ